MFVFSKSPLTHWEGIIPNFQLEKDIYLDFYPTVFRKDLQLFAINAQIEKSSQDH